MVKQLFTGPVAGIQEHFQTSTNSCRTQNKLQLLIRILRLKEEGLDVGRGLSCVVCVLLLLQSVCGIIDANNTY